MKKQKLLVPHAHDMESKQRLEITHTWGMSPERQISQKNQKATFTEDRMIGLMGLHRNQPFQVCFHNLDLVVFLTKMFPK